MVIESTAIHEYPPLAAVLQQKTDVSSCAIAYSLFKIESCQTYSIKVDDAHPALLESCRIPFPAVYSAQPLRIIDKSGRHAACPICHR